MATSVSDRVLDCPTVLTKGEALPVGRVTATIMVANRTDEILASRGVLLPDQIRRITIEDVLMDSGASTLCLPAEIIEQLGLEFAERVRLDTAAGVRPARVYRDAHLHIEGRDDTFSCVELPRGTIPLVGIIPMEAMGIELDLRNQTLKLLPNNGPGTYWTALSSHPQ